MSDHQTTGYPPVGSGLLTVNEVAALLRVSRFSIYRLVRQGDLVPYRVGDRMRFRPEEVDGYLEKTRGGP